MTKKPSIPMRSARDRLVDLLGLGQTYPLRDLPVPEKPLKAAYNVPAKIPIQLSQPDVLYQLHHKHSPVFRSPTKEPGMGAPTDLPIEAPGNGGALLLETYKITDDITFEIFGKKLKTGRAAYLHDTVTVKVGLDTSLPAQILNAPLLDSTLQNPPDTAPRLIQYGQSVQVELSDSQEGVDYELVYLTPAGSGQPPQVHQLSQVVRGTGKKLPILSNSIFEDVDIRIRATRSFDPAEYTPPQVAFLDVVLPLKVRANPALPLTVDPAAIIDFNQPATIKIDHSQPTVTYQLYRRPVRDREFIRPPGSGSGVLTVSVPGQLDVQVPQPPPQPVWQLPAGYGPEGTAQPGNGGVLQLTSGPLTEDSVIIVQAQKMHNDVAPDPQTTPAQIPSAVQLTQALLLLVRPNPAPPLQLKVTMAGTNTTGPLQVSNGQPGVFYYFRLDPTGSDLGLPAYFHQRDDGDQTQNKGLGQLALDWDFVVARSQPPNVAGGNLAQVPPQPPLLDTGPLPVDTPLHIRAAKAQTRVEAPLSHTPQIPSGPAISPENAMVDFGGQTKIRITASRAKEWYQLWADGSPLAGAIKGTGQDRLLDTGPLQTDTTFELLITQPNEPIQVERTLPVTVQVRPDPSLQVTAAQAVVDAGAATDIQVDASQSGVDYQLLAGGNPVGSPVPGSGATILLPTGPLPQDTTFTVRASKAADASIFVDLTQQVAVQVRPDPSLQVTAAQTVVDSGTATDIQVDASQSGVGYQLLAGSSPVGNSVPGNGATILLPTGALTQDTTFTIRASKTADANIFVDLTQQVTVQIKTSP